MKIAYLTILLIISIYFVIGGISNIIINEMFEAAKELPENTTSDLNNGSFRNIAEQNASEEYDKMLTFYPMYKSLGSTLSYIFTLMCFGILGAIIRILLITSTTKISIEELRIYTIPILGGLIGLLTIVISELLPEFKYKSGNEKVYYSLAFLGGIFTQEIFNWLHRKFQQILNADSGNQKEKQ